MILLRILAFLLQVFTWLLAMLAKFPLLPISRLTSRRSENRYSDVVSAKRNLQGAITDMSLVGTNSYRVSHRKNKEMNRLSNSVADDSLLRESPL